jgi:hypothetical protein
MTERSLHPLAEDYLEQLQHAGRDLPPARLRELSADIEDYLSESIAPGASDREAQQALERLGSPSEIIEAEQPAADGPADRRSWREWAAVILLPLGGFVFGVGWLVGLVLLWTSRLWTTRDKLLGTLIVPGGIATVLVVLLLTGTKRRCTDLLTHSSTGTLATTVHCAPSAGPSTATTAWQIALLVFVILGPVITAIYLARRARAAPARFAA